MVKAGGLRGLCVDSRGTVHVCQTWANEEQVLRLREDHAIYMTLDGRINVAGLNNGNLNYIAESFHKVTKDTGLDSQKGDL